MSLTALLTKRVVCSVQFKKTSQYLQLLTKRNRRSQDIAHRNAQGQPRQKIVRHRGSAPAGEIFRALLRLAEVEKQRMEEEVQPRMFPREEPVDLVLKARKQREQDCL